MSQAFVELTGSAVHGIEPERARAAGVDLDRLPTRVCLGRNRPAVRPLALPLSRYLDRDRLAGATIPYTNYRQWAAASVARMYLNDRYGCCVISGKGHAFGLWSGAKSGGAHILVATDQEISDQYFGICGPGDNGCNIQQVLDVCVQRGFKMGGQLYKLDGYVAANWQDQQETLAVQYLFGASTIGINLPADWTNNAVWDVTNSRYVGGHDVTPLDCDDKGVYVASWGRVYLITWAAWKSTKWLEEYWALLSPEWYGNDQLAPNGVKVEELRRDLEIIKSGQLPPIESNPDIDWYESPVLKRSMALMAKQNDASDGGGAAKLPGNLGKRLVEFRKRNKARWTKLVDHLNALAADNGIGPLDPNADAGTIQDFLKQLIAALPSILQIITMILALIPK